MNIKTKTNILPKSDLFIIPYQDDIQNIHLLRQLHPTFLSNIQMQFDFYSKNKTTFDIVSGGLNTKKILFLSHNDNINVIINFMKNFSCKCINFYVNPSLQTLSNIEDIIILLNDNEHKSEYLQNNRCQYIDDWSFTFINCQPLQNDTQRLINQHSLFNEEKVINLFVNENKDDLFLGPDSLSLQHEYEKIYYQYYGQNEIMKIVLRFFSEGNIHDHECVPNERCNISFIELIKNPPSTEDDFNLHLEILQYKPLKKILKNMFENINL